MAMIENVRSNSAMADPQRFGGTTPKNNGKRRRTEKEAHADVKAHAKLMNWFIQERDKQSINRIEMATDEDFYDGLQWSDEDAQELMSRGQAPLVYNQIKPTINWMLGTERRTRIDGKVLPREESDEEGAETKTKLLKYLSDVNRTPFSRSLAFKSMIVAGLGWMEDSISKDPSQELLVTRYVDWKNMYHDSNAKEMDLSDARFIARWSHIDVDVAVALCPDKENIIRAAAVESSQVGMDEDDVWYLGSRVNTGSSGDYAAASRRGMSGGIETQGRERVKIIEMWYTEPVNCTVCRSDNPEASKFHGEVYDANNTEMRAAMEDGYMSIAQHVKMEMRVAIMTEGNMLYNGKSPYKHNRFPFTPMWGYRKHRDLLPYGVVRDIRDAQIDYNKRASKALYILSTVRVIMEEDAVEDIENLRAEIARPDSIIVKGKGKELVIEQDKQLAEQHIKLMMFDGQMIRDVGGVTDQNLGKDDKGLSGQAIGKLQDQGSIVTAYLFDNMRLAIQMQTELQLSLLEQFYSAPKVLRIIGENKPIEWLKINVYDEQAGKYLNDITRSKADFIVSEQDFRASTRQAMFESMMELIAKLPPEVGLAMLDMVIDFADVPNKEELVARIRKLNGQVDPSRKLKPEEVEAKAASDKKAAEVDQINLDTARAQMELAQAQVEKVLAEMQKIAADTQRLNAIAIEQGVKSFYESLQAAQIVATVPGVAVVADAIMAGAGYQEQGGDDPNIPGQAQEAAMQIDQMAGAPQALPPPDMAAPPELQQADGAAAGIETPAPDGVI